MEQGSEEEPVMMPPDGRGALLDAAKSGDLAEVQRLCNETTMRGRDLDSGWSPLTWASSKGHLAVVQYLCEQGAAEAELEQPRPSGDETPAPFCKTSPLHWAAYKGHAHVLWTLLLNGMSPLQVDSENNTPLHLAAAWGHLALVKTLLSVCVDENGAEQPVSVKAKNIYGNTAVQVTKSEECKALLHEAAAAAVLGKPFLCSCSGVFVSAHDSIAASVIDRVSTPTSRPARYSKESAAKITAAEDALHAAIKAHSDPAVLEAALEAAESIGTSVPLLDEASATLLLLQAQIALQDQMAELNKLRPLPSRAHLKPLMGPLKQCRARGVQAALIEQVTPIINQRCIHVPMPKHVQL